MIKFMAFGDLHYDDVPDVDRRIAELLAHAEETKPDFIISLGDLCYPAEKNKAVLEKLCSAGIPLYHTIGNHDTENCHLKNTLKFLSMKKPYYSFEYDDVKFIVLNSCYLYRNGVEIPYLGRNYKEDGAIYPVVPSYETEWLKNELNDGKRHIIFSHHSLVNSHRDRGISNRSAVRDMLREKNVLLCMNGHDHGDDVKVIDNITYYTVNSASYMWCGFQIMASEKLMKKYGYLNGFLFYKQAFFVNVEIDNSEIRISGMDGEYMSVTPDDVELYDYKWNGVSVRPQTSSYVIKL